MTLTDTGADAVAWNLSDAGGGRQSTGSFKRSGLALEGTRPLEMRGVAGELTVKARIEAPDTIVVFRSEFKPRDSRTRPPPPDNTKHTWTRQTNGENGDAGRRRRAKWSPTGLTGPHRRRLGGRNQTPSDRGPARLVGFVRQPHPVLPLSRYRMALSPTISVSRLYGQSPETVTLPKSRSAFDVLVVDGKGMTT